MDQGAQDTGSETASLLCPCGCVKASRAGHSHPSLEQPCHQQPHGSPCEAKSVPVEVQEGRGKEGHPARGWKAPLGVPPSSDFFLEPNLKDATLSRTLPSPGQTGLSCSLFTLLPLPSTPWSHQLCMSKDHQLEVQLRPPGPPTPAGLGTYGEPGTLRSHSFQSGPHSPARSTAHLTAPALPAAYFIFPTCLGNAWKVGTWPRPNQSAPFGNWF